MDIDVRPSGPVPAALGTRSGAGQPAEERGPPLPALLTAHSLRLGSGAFLWPDRLLAATHAAPVLRLPGAGLAAAQDDHAAQEPAAQEPAAPEPMRRLRHGYQVMELTRV
jgi:hypothetical protein